MRQTRMSGAMRGSQETKTVPKGIRLRACSLLYMTTISLLMFACGLGVMFGAGLMP